MSRVTQAEYDRLLKRCEEQAREIRKLKGEIAREVKRGFNLDDQLTAVRLEMDARNSAEQSRIRRRTQDQIARGSYRNGEA